MSEAHNSSNEKSGAGFVEYLVEMTRRALTTDLLGQPERESLERIPDTIKIVFEEVMGHATSGGPQNSTALRDHVDILLWDLMGMAFTVGSNASLSSAAIKYTRRKQAKLARAAPPKKPKTIEMNNKKLARLNAVRKVAERMGGVDALKNGADFANSILPEVCKFLGLDPKAATEIPSVRTIRRDIERLKKEVHP